MASVSRNESSSAVSSGRAARPGAAQATPLLHAFLGGPHRPGVREDLFPQAELLQLGGQREQRPRVAHREPAGAKVRADELGQLEQTETVRDRAPILAHPLGQIFLGPAELGEQPLIGLGLLDRIQVLTQEVLDERELEALRVRTSRTTAGMRSSPASLAARQRRSPTMS